MKTSGTSSGNNIVKSATNFIVMLLIGIYFFALSLHAIQFISPAMLFPVDGGSFFDIFSGNIQNIG